MYLQLCLLPNPDYAFSGITIKKLRKKNYFVYVRQKKK